MAPARHASRSFIAGAALAVLAACSGSMEHAQKLMAQIQGAVNAASADAGRYAPERLRDVQDQVSRLQEASDRKDYSTVISAGPAVLASAQALAPAAAAEKKAVIRALDAEWSEVTGKLPDQLIAIQHRMAELSKRSNRKLAQGIDLTASKSSIDTAMSLWSKAQSAFAAGNLDEAVSTAKEVRTRFRAIADSIRM